MVSEGCEHGIRKGLTHAGIVPCGRVNSEGGAHGAHPKARAGRGTSTEEGDANLRAIDEGKAGNEACLILKLGLEGSLDSCHRLRASVTDIHAYMLVN
jgi:hypothetical protein